MECRILSQQEIVDEGFTVRRKLPDETVQEYCFIEGVNFPSMDEKEVANILVYMEELWENPKRRGAFRRSQQLKRNANQNRNFVKHLKGEIKLDKI